MILLLLTTGLLPIISLVSIKLVLLIKLNNSIFTGKIDNIYLFKKSKNLHQYKRIRFFSFEVVYISATYIDNLHALSLCSTLICIINAAEYRDADESVVPAKRISSTQLDKINLTL